MADKVPDTLPLGATVVPPSAVVGGLYALAGLTPPSTRVIEAPPPRKHGGRALKDDDDEDEHPERKRNRAAVRNYRARKKAYTASLEEEVKQLRLQNFLLMHNLKGNELDANAAALAANSLTSQPPVMIPGQQEKLSAQILALQQAQAPPPPPQPSLLQLGLVEEVLQKAGQQPAVSEYQPVQPLPVNMIQEQAAAEAHKQVAAVGLVEPQASSPAEAAGGVTMDPQAALIMQLLESRAKQQQQQLSMLALGVGGTGMGGGLGKRL